MPCPNCGAEIEHKKTRSVWRGHRCPTCRIQLSPYRRASARVTLSFFLPLILASTLALGWMLVGIFARTVSPGPKGMKGALELVPIFLGLGVFTFWGYATFRDGYGRRLPATRKCRALAAALLGTLVCLGPTAGLVMLWLHLSGRVPRQTLLLVFPLLITGQLMLCIYLVFRWHYVRMRGPSEAE